jgi:FkbM family methyltransferase
VIEPGMGAFLSILNPAISAIKRCPAAAIMIRRVRDGIISRRAPKATSMGFKFAGLKAMQRGEFEPHETAIVRRILPAVDIFINVGANTGYYCCWALSSGKHTVAFEPIDTNLRVLYRNIQANRFESPFEVFPVALSDAAGLTTIYGSGTGASLIRGWSHIDEKDLRVVPVMRLDDVLGGRFRGQKCFVLVDIEGAEYRMLLGGREFLKREPKPIWMVEICTHEHQPQGIQMNPYLVATFELFWENGYVALTADGHTRLVDRAEIREIAATGNCTLGTHNLLFMSPEDEDRVFHSRPSDGSLATVAGLAPS